MRKGLPFRITAGADTSIFKMIYNLKDLKEILKMGNHIQLYMKELKEVLEF